jgi:putative DNA primase/helicase
VRVTPTTVEPRTEELRWLLETRFSRPKEPPRASSGGGLGDDDEELLARAHAATNGAAFDRLWHGDCSGYPSQSEADLALCGMLAAWTRGDAARVDRLFRASGLMRPKWDERRGERTYGARTIEYALAGRSESYAGRENGSQSQTTTTVPRRLTDDGNAYRLVDRHGDDLRYVPGIGWHAWDGTRWLQDSSGAALRRARDLARLLHAEADGKQDEELQKALKRHAKASSSRRGLEAMLWIARSDERVLVEAAALDADPLLLNAPNGTIDLRTGAGEAMRSAGNSGGKARTRAARR